MPIEVPDLASKSKQYLKELGCRLLQIKNKIKLDISDSGERNWLILYGILSNLYRFILMLSIAWILSGKYFIFGSALAAWIVVSMIVLPIGRLLKFIASETSEKNSRPFLISMGSLASVFAFVAFLPMPLTTVVEGVVWLPENAIVRTSNDCNVTKLMAYEGKHVKTGEPLFICEDFSLPSKIKILKAELRELKAEYAGIEYTERVQKAILSGKIDTAKARLALANKMKSQEYIRANADGRFIVSDSVALQDRFISHGAIAAYVIPAQSRAIHVAIRQAEIHNIKNGTNSIEIQIPNNLTGPRTYTTSISQEIPQASLSVTSLTQTTTGGGRLLADPAGDGTTVLEPVFQLQLGWPQDAPETNIGSRVFVRMRHDSKPIFYRMLTSAQRALLQGQRV